MMMINARHYLHGLASYWTQILPSLLENHLDQRGLL